MEDQPEHASDQLRAPALWLEPPRLDPTRSGAGPGSSGGVGSGISCLRVAAWTTGGASAAAAVEFGATRGGRGLRSRLLRSGRGGYELGQVLGSMDTHTGLAVVPDDVQGALAVVAEARRAGMLERLWMTSVDLGVLEAVRRDSPATRLLHTCDPARVPLGPERHAADVRERGIEGVMVACDRVSAGLVALMARFGRTVAAEGAEYPRMVRSAANAGVDIICGPTAQVLHDGVGH